MAYPVAALPYGLIRRLYELAAPLEQINLDEAASNAPICPAPFRYTYQHCRHPTFAFYAGRVSMLDVDVNLQNKERLISEGTVTLRRLDVARVKPQSEWWGNILSPEKFKLVNCHVTRDFVNKVAPMMTDRNAVQRVFVQQSEQVSFELLFELVPNASELGFKAPLPKTWLTDIVKCQKRKLKEFTLYIKKENMPKWEDLREFISAQENDLTINFKTSDAFLEVYLWRTLEKEEFLRTWEHKAKPKATINVIQGHQCSRYYVCQ